MAVEAVSTVAQAAGPAQGVPRTYTSEEAAALLGVSRNVLSDNWQAFGGIRIGRTLRFPRAHVDALVAPPEVPDEPMSRTAADPRIDAVLAATQVACRELARLLKAHRREARDTSAKEELGAAQMAVEDCLGDLNALAAGRPR